MIALVVVGVVLLGCCGIGAAIVAPIFGQYAATVDTPATLAGLTKQQNSEIDKLGEQLGQDLKNNAKVDKAVAGLYAEGSDETKLVLVVGASALLFSPDKEVENAFKAMTDSGLPVSNIAEVDAGDLGGTVKCGTGTVSGVALSVCAWGDHGSIGMGIFYDRPVAESSALFEKIRTGMLKRD